MYLQGLRADMNQECRCRGTLSKEAIKAFDMVIGDRKRAVRAWCESMAWAQEKNMLGQNARLVSVLALCSDALKGLPLTARNCHVSNL